MRQRWPALLLVATNLVPLVGVLGFGWHLLEVMLAYWLQGLILVTFAAGRLLVRGGTLGAIAAPLYLLAMAVPILLQLMFIVLYFFVVPLGHDFWGMLAAAPDILRRVAWAGAVLVLAQAVAFALFLRSGDDRAPAWRLALAPTGHALALYVTTCVAGVFVYDWGRPTLALGLLVLLKVGVDVAELALEERMARPPAADEWADVAGAP